MRRWSLRIILVVFSGSLAFSEQPGGQLFSSDLVQWSYMQESQAPDPGTPRQAPTPEPSPETQPAQNPSPSPAAHPAKPASPPASGESAAAQTFTGTVSKDADSFVLKVSETASYKLDNSSDVQQYEGQRVRVTGTLDSSINLIHVDKIEPMS